MALKITNVGKSIRRIDDGGTWVLLPPKQSHIMKNRIASHQLFIRDSPICKIEEVDESSKKIRKKGELNGR